MNVVKKLVCKFQLRISLQDAKVDLIFSTSLQKVDKVFLRDEKIVLIFCNKISKNLKKLLFLMLVFLSIF